jgi:catechol 2,3-dioxygenase-like lactoylglutathione lyase family enzyme
VITGIHHFALTVSDMDRSLAFYRDLFGLEVLSDREVERDYVEEITAVGARPGGRRRARRGRRDDVGVYRRLTPIVIVPT